MENDNLFKPRTTKLIWTGILTAEFMVLTIACVLLFFAEPMADDFSRAVASKGMSVWGFVKFRYETWTGRWAAMAVTSSFSRFDFISYYFITLIGLGVAFAGSLHFFVCSMLRKRFFNPAAVVISLSIMLLYWSSIDAPGQTVYWFCGGVDYHGVAVFGFVLFGLLVRAYDANATLKSTYSLVLLPVILFLPGFHEYWAVICCTILLFFTIAAFNMKHSSRWLLAWSLVFLIGSSLLAIMAPGHKVRGDLFEHSFDVKNTIIITSHKMTEILSFWLCNVKLWAGTILLLFMPGLTSKRFGGQGTKLLWWFGLILLFLLAISIAGPTYVINKAPPRRYLNVVALLFISGWFVMIIAIRSQWEYRSTKETKVLLRPILLVAAMVWSLSLLTIDNTPNAIFDLAGKLPRYKKTLRHGMLS
ncbi:MAG: hypothetical protein JEZ07_01895 [Phycisphaerae bacterium]|nr:hypothetical protein [Phycisphaerae bacterium]